MENLENQSIYDSLVQASKEITTLSSIDNLLSWDGETYMPDDGSSFRSEQSALLSAIVHEKKIEPSFKKSLSKLIDLETGNYKDNSLDENEKTTLTEWRREYINATKLPTTFVKEMSKATSEGVSKWAEARKENSFQKFSSHLDKIVKLSREQSKLLGYDDHPYDALLDHYEPSMTTKIIDPIFSSLKDGLISLLEKIRKKDQPSSSFLEIDCSEDIQMKLSKKIMSLMGLKTNFCRIDKSTHPFSVSFSNDDIRMTTRFLKNNFFSNILTTLHEGGHSLYQRQLPRKYFGTPLADPISFGIHESQSRWWETLIGKSVFFNRFFLKEIKKEMPKQFNDIKIDAFYKAINKVTPTFIRVEADEVTYSLHIILRYEIEKALIAGEMEVSDIPSVWNDKMKQYFDITPKNDNQGCLQDVHWSLGYFGYFPTYALGNIYASCFYKSFKKENPTFKELIENGDFSFINKWLNKNIHNVGKRYSALELIKKVTNTDFSSRPYLTYLTEKYSDIYGF